MFDFEGFSVFLHLFFPVFVFFNFGVSLMIRRGTAPPLSVVLVLVGGLQDRATDFCRLVEGTCGVFSALLESTAETNSASIYGNTGRSKVSPATGSHVLGFWAA